MFVCIDGDLFAPIIPDEKLLHTVREHFVEAHQTDLALTKHPFLASAFYTFDRGCPATFVKVEGAAIDGKFLGHTGEWVALCTDSNALWCPCLIPLARNGKVIRGMEAGEDWETVTWGSVYLDDQPVVTNPSLIVRPANFLHQASTLRVGEGMGEPYDIQWIWYNGLLFSLNVMIEVSPELLTNSGLIQTETSWVMDQSDRDLAVNKAYTPYPDSQRRPLIGQLLGKEGRAVILPEFGYSGISGGEPQ